MHISLPDQGSSSKQKKALRERTTSVGRTKRQNFSHYQRKCFLHSHIFAVFFFYNFLISESVSQGHEYGHRAAGQSQFSILGWQIPLLPPESTSHCGRKDIIERGTFFTSVINFAAHGHKSIFCILFVYLKILVHKEKKRKTRAIICSLIDVTIP